MKPQIRKIVTYDEEILIEGFRAAKRPWRMFAVAAIIQNPWAGRFVEDLKPQIQAFGLIHTLPFGNHYRQAVDAKSYLAFTNTRGGANAPIMVPLMDTNDVGRRSHYLTIQFAIPDAPRDDEVVIVLGAATSGRPHHRIGDRYQDLKDLGHDVDNPAAV